MAHDSARKTGTRGTQFLDFGGRPTIEKETLFSWETWEPELGTGTPAHRIAHLLVPLQETLHVGLSGLST